MSWPTFKLTTVLLIITLGLLILVSTVFAIISYESTQQALQREVQRSFDNRNKIIELSIGDTLDRASQKVSSMAKLASYNQWSYASDLLGAEVMLESFTHEQVDGYIDVLALIKPDRSIQIVSTLPLKLHADKALAAFVEAGELSGQWQLIIVGGESKSTSALVNSVPIIEPEVGRVVAYIIYGITISDNAALANELRNDADIEALELLVDSGVVAISFGEKSLIDGREVLSSVRVTDFSNDNHQLAVRSYMQNNFQDELDISFRDNLFVLLSALIVAMLVALILIRRITTVGFGRLLKFAAESSSGGNSVPSPRGAISDFNVLGRSLEEMVSSISDNQRYLDAVLQEAVSPLIIWNERMQVVRINRAAEKLLGMPTVHFVGSPIADVFSSANWCSEPIDDLLLRVVIGAPKQSFETVFGEGVAIAYIAWDMTPIRYRPNNEDQTYVAQGTDITEIRLAEGALKESEEQIRMLLNSTAEAIYGIDLLGSCTMANPACVRLLGYEAEEDLMGKDIDDLIHYAYADGTAFPKEAFRIHHAILGGRGIHADHEVFWRKDGGSFPVEYWAFPIVRDKVVMGAVVSFLDISQRKADEREIKNLRNYLKNIIDSMPSMLVGVDNKGVVTQWNREAERQTGINSTDAYGKALDHVVPLMKQEMGRVSKAIQGRYVEQQRKRVEHVDGENRYSDITIFPLIADGVRGAVIRIDDITDRVQMEELMIQSEKMGSVGGLAAGMAHEINNPLAGILQNMQVIDQRLSLDNSKNLQAAESLGLSLEAIRDYMEQRGLLRAISVVTESGQRAAKIVANMLSFSRKSDSLYTQVDFADLVEKTIELVSNDYDLKKNYDFRRITIIREFEPGLPMLYCEASKIQQALLNLFKNGAHAMTNNLTAPQFTIRLVREHAFIRLEVEDNGPGMDETVRKRIFEPFFTTKEVGEGTGLGLSVSYFLITQDHKGTMSVESSPGNGTKFIIRLPLEMEVVEKMGGAGGFA